MPVLLGWAAVTILAGDFPVEQHIFHSRTSADVMDDHATSAGSLPVHDDSDMGNTAAQIPGDQVSAHSRLQRW